MNKPNPKPHKVVCISFYLEDIARADAIVNALKMDGFTNMNRSRLLRLALDQFDTGLMKPEDNYR